MNLHDPTAGSPSRRIVPRRHQVPYSRIQSQSSDADVWKDREVLRAVGGLQDTKVHVCSVADGVRGWEP